MVTGGSQWSSKFVPGNPQALRGGPASPKCHPKDLSGGIPEPAGAPRALQKPMFSLRKTLIFRIPRIPEPIGVGPASGRSRERPGEPLGAPGNSWEPCGLLRIGQNRLWDRSVQTSISSFFDSLVFYKSNFGLFFHFRWVF